MELRKFIKTTIREYLNGQHLNNFDVYNPENYLDDFYNMDFNEEMYSEKQALEIIQKEIDYVKNLKTPLKIYRGINTKSPMDSFDGWSWSTDKKVAESFGDKIFVGLLHNKNEIDIEQTIRTRVMNPYEKEISIPHDSNSIEIIDTYEK